MVVHLEGSFDTPASKSSVWEYLLSPKDVAPCLPDLQSLQVVDEDRFKAKLKVGVKAIKGTMDFDFNFADRIPMSSAKLIGKGQGLASTIEIEAKFTLTDTSEATKVMWVTDVSISGMLAGLSKKMIDSIATEWINEVVDNLKNRLDIKGTAK